MWSMYGFVGKAICEHKEETVIKVIPVLDQTTSKCPESIAARLETAECKTASCHVFKHADTRAVSAEWGLGVVCPDGE